MATYTAQYKFDTSWRGRKFLREFGLVLLILGLISHKWYFDPATPEEYKQDFLWVFPLLLVFLTLGRLIFQKSVVQQVEVFQADRKLRIETLHPLTGRTKREISFDALGVILNDYKGNWLIGPEKRISFLKAKKEVFRLSDHRGYFSHETLNALMQELEDLTRAVQ